MVIRRVHPRHGPSAAQQPGSGWLASLAQHRCDTERAQILAGASRRSQLAAALRHCDRVFSIANLARDRATRTALLEGQGWMCLRALTQQPALRHWCGDATLLAALHAPAASAYELRWREDGAVLVRSARFGRAYDRIAAAAAGAPTPHANECMRRASWDGGNGGMLLQEVLELMAGWDEFLEDAFSVDGAQGVVARRLLRRRCSETNTDSACGRNAECPSTRGGLPRCQYWTKSGVSQPSTRAWERPHKQIAKPDIGDLPGGFDGGHGAGIRLAPRIFRHDGEVAVAATHAEADALAVRLAAQLDVAGRSWPAALGFDIEYGAMEGSGRWHPPALLQLAAPRGLVGVVWLDRLPELGRRLFACAPALTALLTEPGVLKVGVGSVADAQALVDFAGEPTTVLPGVLDLNDLPPGVAAAAGMGFQLDGRFQRCLAGWCRELLGAKLLKRKRRSIGAAASAPPPHGGGWRPEAGPLPLDLLTYAAEDAAAALGVWEELGRRLRRTDVPGLRQQLRASQRTVWRQPFGW